MKSQALTILGTAAYSVGVAALSTNELTDHQALMIALSSGFAGGVFATFVGRDPVTFRTLMVRILACCLGVPILALFVVLKYVGDGSMTLAPVVASCGISALFAWVAVEKLGSALGGIKAGDIRAWIMRMIGK